MEKDVEGLEEYERKRNFGRTAEPAADHPPKEPPHEGLLRFVVQKHAARRLHYDLRLELGGVLKSWAVPKGPSMDPGIRSLAVHVEDHPMEYRHFEGTIPEGEYGGGTVLLWDRGHWIPNGDPFEGYERGKLRFRLSGERLEGEWLLVRMEGKAGDNDKNWLFQKLSDWSVRSDDAGGVTERHLTSVATGRTLDEIAGEATGHPEHGERSQGILPDPPAQAPASSLPSVFRPQLPTLVRQAPEGDDWLHELKIDGYRILGKLDGGAVALMTRGGLDWSRRFPAVTQALRDLGVDGTIFDGEVAVLAGDGTTDFQALQQYLERGRTDAVGYFVFDLPFYRGHDLQQIPLVERKTLLRTIVDLRSVGTVIRYSDHIVGQGGRVAQHACRHALEGVVAKRKNAPYRQERHPSWVKVKCVQQQEFVVGGWTDPSGARSGFGALLLGWFDQDRLIYCGRVGTGFSSESLARIRRQLEDLATNAPPFENPPAGDERRGVHWVKPALVAEVAFTGWTENGRLRHPSFRELRMDMPPQDVTRETPQPQAMGGPVQDQSSIAGVRLSHPDRVLYPEQGVTKHDLAAYYEAVAPWILPHLVGRPLSLVRCPRGQGEPCFYQKHLPEGMPDPVRGIKVGDRGDDSTYMAVDDVRGLVTLIQFGVLELHPWGSREDRLERPDRIVLDLDPGEGVRWGEVADAARLLRTRLADLGLESFLRLTGGKGLHVVVPITRRSTWDEVKEFSRDIARGVEREDRDRFVSSASKAKRTGKTFIDYLRNGRGATAIASYSTRARAGAPVAVPIRWEELSDVEKPDFYTVANVPSRLRTLDTDPWQGFFESHQTLTKGMREAAAAD